MLIVLAGSCNY